MKHLIVVIIGTLFLGPTLAFAEVVEPPSDAAPEPVPVVEPVPEPVPVVEPVPEPVIAPVVVPDPAPVPVAEPVVVKPPPPSPRKYDYYGRLHGLGIFHDAHVTLGVLSGDTPNLTTPPAVPGEAPMQGATMFAAAFEGTYLGLPSSFGNVHGIEFSTGIRTSPFDYWLSVGTAVTLLNLGHGQPGSLRIGGSFGIGFNFAHAYAYVKARTAIVVVPELIDIEGNVQWTPREAGTGNYDETSARVSVWYRLKAGRARAVELYVERMTRVNPTGDGEREFEGYGAGVGLTLF